jgi:hypothetical protein
VAATVSALARQLVTATSVVRCATARLREASPLTLGPLRRGRTDWLHWWVSVLGGGVDAALKRGKHQRHGSDIGKPAMG